MKRIYFAFVFSLLFNITFSQSVLTMGTTTVIVDTVFTNLDVPWEILYGPDDHLWITERKGIVSRIDPVNKTKDTILDLTSTVRAFGESGMLGMAFHPDFPATPEVFIAYNFGPMYTIKMRLVKYSYTGGVLTNSVILIDSIRGNSNHDGARLLFMPDKTLLMTMGESGLDYLAQDMNSLNGKILRLNSDGSIPFDNPFPNSYIYSLGHRNPQGLAYGPYNYIYTTEHGPENDDEFQMLEKGRNYGWPDVVGYCDQPAEQSFCLTKNIKEPMMDWTPTLAVGDIEWYSNNSFPELDERMLMVCLKTKMLVGIKLNVAGTATVTENYYLQEMFGRLRAVCVGPDKEIYIATNGAYPANLDAGQHSIIRLRPPKPVVSLSENDEIHRIRIYPTVVTELVNVEALPENCVIEVWDMFGRTLQQERGIQTSQQLNFAGLGSGMYLIKIKRGDRTVTLQKVTKIQ